MVFDGFRNLGNFYVEQRGLMARKGLRKKGRGTGILREYLLVHAIWVSFEREFGYESSDIKFQQSTLTN